MEDCNERICSLLRKKDMEGMALLFKEYYRPLVLWADSFLNNTMNSEDLIQDFFVRLWEKHQTDHLLPTTLRAYLFTAVKNLALNSLEKCDPLKRSCAVSSFSEIFATETDDLTEQLLQRIEMEIENLPSQSRNVVKCVYQRGMRYKDAALELNVSEATVKTLLVNSLKKLRERMNSYKIELLLWMRWA